MNNKRVTSEDLILPSLMLGVIVTILIVGFKWNIIPSVLVGLGGAVIVGVVTRPWVKK